LQGTKVCLIEDPGVLEEMVVLVHRVLVGVDGRLTDDEAATAIDVTFSEANDDNINFMQARDACCFLMPAQWGALGRRVKTVPCRGCCSMSCTSTRACAATLRATSASRCWGASQNEINNSRLQGSSSYGQDLDHVPITLLSRMLGNREQSK